MVRSFGGRGRFLLLSAFLFGACPLAAQRPTGVAPGVDTTTASLLISLQPMQTLTQALTIKVIFGPPMTLAVYKGARMINGVKVGVPVDSMLVGETGCFYAVVSDRLGNQVAGLGPVTYTSGNTAVLSIGTGANCSSYTVKLADIPIIP